MSEQTPSLPKDPKGWAEYLTKLDYKDHKKTMVGIGAAAALGLGVGVYVISKKHGGGRFFVRYGDWRMEDKNVISVGESAEHGMAVGVPTNEEAIQKVGDGREIFSMGEEAGFQFPLENETHVAGYKRALEKVAGWMIDHFSTISEPEK